MLAWLVPSLAALLITGLLCATALRALNGWLDFRRLELGHETRKRDGAADVGLRIELSAVKERLKKLEAIASGVEY